MYRVVANSPSAPAAIGPYSHSVRARGELLFISGQVGADPATGELVGETAAQQARQCLENLHAIANDVGGSLEDAVKLTVYLTDMAAYPEVNEVYASFFKHEPPARVALAVVGLPKGALVEIDAVVALGD